MVDPMVSRLAKNLGQTEPVTKGNRFAAVSVMIRDTEFPSVLLIKRAEKAGDPWSGQIAFPGGKAQAGDADIRQTAIRETMEEVGVDLSHKSDFLGYAPPTTTHTGNMDVVPAAFVLREAVEVRTNEEVASYRWVDLHDLASPASKTTYELDYGGRSVTLPAIRIGDYLVWGLTHRILTTLLEER